MSQETRTRARSRPDSLPASRLEREIMALGPAELAQLPPIGDAQQGHPARLAAGMQAALDATLARGNGLAWLVLAMGAGILGYFALPAEPHLWALCALLLTLVVLCWRLRHSAWLFAGLMAAGLVFGMAWTTGQARLADGPQLLRESVGQVSGRVVRIEQQSASQARLTLSQLTMEDVASEETPARARLTVIADAGTISPGDRIEVLAQLGPPPEQVMPGARNMRRELYFAGIGATGFSYGRARVIEAPRADETLLERAGAHIERTRQALALRFAQHLSGDTSALASTLLVGRRDSLSDEAYEALRRAGLAHLLAISGMHMAMMTLSALAIIRLALAFSPVLSASRSITRWTAIGALCIATGYLALSGASTATQRAFIMIAIVLFALMMGRRALTIRGLALAALLVLLIHPESLLGPSFQMSFAATLALVAGYGLLSRSPAIWKMRLKAAQTASFVPTFIARPVRTLAAIALTSLIAGLATAPFAAYHFSVGTPWALLGNMLALPLVSIIIMPAGLIALVLTPLALEGLPLQLMGLGLEGVMVIARWVASLDGAYVAIPAITPSALALMGLGGCALALAEGRARWLGLAPLLAIPFVGLFQPVPVMLVERTGRLVALVSQNDEGQTFLDRSVQNGSRFAVDMWSQRLAITPSFPQGQTAWTCDGLGCAAHLDERTLVVHVRDPAAMEEDCALAAILVTELEVPPGCGAPILVDGKLLQVHGAVALLPDLDAETGYRLWFSIHQRSRPWEAVGR